MVWDFFHFANLARKGLIKFSNGKIIVTGLRVFFVDVDTLEGLALKLKEVMGSENGSRITYEVAKDAGSRATQAHYRFSKKSGEELVKYMSKMASGAGWGCITVVNAQAEGEVMVQNSPFKLKGEKMPTCDFLRGLFAGAASYVYRKKIDCIEIECISLGASRCKFLVGKREYLLRQAKNKKFAYQIVAPEEKMPAATKTRRY